MGFQGATVWVFCCSLLLLLQCWCEGVTLVKIHARPTRAIIPVGEVATVWIGCRMEIERNGHNLQHFNSCIVVQPEDSSIASVQRGLIDIPKDNNQMVNSTLTIHGLKSGRTKLVFNFTNIYNGTGPSYHWLENGHGIDSKDSGGASEYSVTVIRAHSVGDDVFLYLLAVVHMMAALVVGCGLSWEQMKQVFLKPYSLVIAVGCHTLLMPMICFALAAGFMLPSHLAAGLLLTGCGPVGEMTIIYAVLQEANIELGVALVLVTLVLAFGTMHMWLAAYTSFWPERVSLTLPYDHMAILLVITLLPVTLGLALTLFDKTKSSARALSRLILPISFFVILVTFANDVRNAFFTASLLTMPTAVSSVLLPVSGATVGSIIAIIMQQRFEDIKTVAMATGIQSTMLATMATQLSFVQPEGDITSSIPATVSVTTTAFMVVLCLVHFLAQCKSMRYKKLHPSAKSINNLAVFTNKYMSSLGKKEDIYAISNRVVKSMLQAGEITFKSPSINGKAKPDNSGGGGGEMKCKQNWTTFHLYFNKQGFDKLKEQEKQGLECSETKF